MKKAFAALAVLITLVGYSAWNCRVRIPLSNIYVWTMFKPKPRLWGNAVEFDHHGWQEICLAENGKAKCVPLVKASPQ